MNCLYPISKTTGITALNVDDAGTAETADQPFTRREAGDPAGRSFLDIVRRRGGPGDQMAIVDDVFFIGLQLDFMNRAETIEHELPRSADLQNKKSLPAQQAAGEALHFALNLHAFGAGQESVFLHHVFIHAIEIHQDDFAGHRRRQQDFSRSAAGPQRLKEKLSRR